MSNPTQTCVTCGRERDCMLHYPRSPFPPDAAKRWLLKTCPKNREDCDIRYRAGFQLGGPVTGQAATPEHP